MSIQVTITLLNSEDVDALMELIHVNQRIPYARLVVDFDSTDRFSPETISFGAPISVGGDEGVKPEWLYGPGGALENAVKPDHMRKADARAKIKRARIKADAFIAEQQAELERKTKADDDRAEKAWRKQAKLNLMMDAIGHGECPQCEAKKGKPCSGPNGEPRERYAHPARIDAMLRGISARDMRQIMGDKLAERHEIERINETVECSKCGAERFMPCRTRSGNVLSAYVHSARREAFEATPMWTGVK